MKRFLFILVLVLLATLPQPSALTQETTAKGFVENLLESVLASEGRTLSVENVDISLTGDVTVGHVEVNDDEGAWLVIDGLTLVWKPLSLFGDQLEVDSIAVSQVHLLRMPQSPEGSVAAPQELQDLRAAIIRKLSIDDMKIDKPVLGQDAELKLEGSGEITATPVKIRIDATASRLDGKKGDLRISVDLDPKTRKFVTTVALSEEDDGIVSSLLSLRGEPSVALALKASGDFSTWAGGFSLDIDGERTIEGKASSSRDTGGQTIMIDGTGAMSRLLPQSLENIFGGASSLSVLVHVPDEGGAAEIDHASLSNDVLSLGASGVADWTGTRTNLAVELASKVATAELVLPETGLLGQAAVTGLSATMRLHGELANPSWQASLAWASAKSDRANLDQLEADLEGQGILPTLKPINFKGAIKTELSQGRHEIIPSVLLGAVTGDLSGIWWSGDRLQIANAALSAGAISFETSGVVKPKAGTYDLTVSARADSPGTGNKLVDRLMHGPVTLEGHIVGGQQGVAGLKDLTVTSAALSARTTGTISADSVDLSLDVALPDLALLHSDITGSTQLHAALAGPWLNLDAMLQGTGEKVTLLGKPFDRPSISAHLNLSNSAPQGDFAVSGSLAGKPVDIRANVETDTAGTMSLRGFTATAGEARMIGEFSWPSGGQPTGKLTFDAPQLRDVGPLFLSGISGTLTGAIGMSGSGNSHQTRIEFNGHGIEMGSLALGHAEGSVTIATLFRQPRPSGSVALASVRMGIQSFDMIDATAEAISQNTYKLTATAVGRELSADATGEVTIGEKDTTFAVSRLSGKARDVTFVAAAPFTIRSQGEAVSVDGAVLNVGAGRLKVAGQLMPRLDAAIGLTDLPLSIFEKPAAVPGLQGTLAGDVSLSGTTSAPEGRFDLKATDVNLDTLRDQGLGRFTATASGNLKDNRITVSTVVNAGAELSVAGQGTIDLAKPGRIDMGFTGKTGSTLFSDQLARSGLRAEGDIGFDLQVTGPLAQPDISGTMDVSKGIIGDTSGLYTFRNVNARLDLRDRILRVVSLTGTTGRKGRGTATGSLDFDDGMSINLRAKISNGDYSDGSFVTSRYDADLALTGSFASGLLLSGEIGLRDTKITLSELPRRAISPLDVTHSHAPPAVKQQATKLRSRNSGSSAVLSLDLKLRALDSISVSGRGLNVVLNGGLRLHGALGGLAAQGSFSMFRGRLALPARSLDFERGTLTFDRNFDPLINFVAVSKRSDATITLTISGRASEPVITVTSAPQLPPEEAMARLIFDNSMLELSPLQIAQIASYVATLSGGGGSGLLSGLESALGVDWLTVRQNESGETEIGVAKRINDRLSLGVEQTTKSNTTRVIIDLSATKSLKLRGSVDTDQSSRIGVYYEKDY